MKTCQCCGATCSPDVSTCPACGQASWTCVADPGQADTSKVSRKPAPKSEAAK